MATIRESDLPGIGRKFQVETRSGDLLMIIVHDSGTRELYHVKPQEPENILSRIALDDLEARQVAGIIGGLTYRPQALEALELPLEEMVIEWYKVESGQAAVDKSIRDLQVRQHTGATIIAVIEPDGTQRINPEPDQIIQQGATLVVIGRREHIQALKQLIGGEER